MTNQFTIRNDSNAALILVSEPLAIDYSLAAGERIVIKEVFEKEPLELTFSNHEGRNSIAIWPGDGEFRVEKDGKDVFGLP